MATIIPMDKVGKSLRMDQVSKLVYCIEAYHMISSADIIAKHILHNMFHQIPAMYKSYDACMLQPFPSGSQELLQ